MFALKIRHAVVAAAAFATLAACGGDSSTGPNSIVGSFTLSTVNGKPLPVTLVDSINGQPVFTIVIKSPSSLTINSGGTFAFTLTATATEPGMAPITATQTVNGTYTLTGSTVVLTANGDTITGTWSGDTITLNDSGDVLVFQR
jgi:hypothetical protein